MGQTGLTEEELDGTSFFSTDYFDAIIGISEDNRLIYDYDRMIGCLMKEDSMSFEEAAEFIDYNTLRTIPYMGDKAPIIMHEIHIGI